MKNMTDIQTFYPLILALFAAGATGLMGSFALMKKMTLAGDTMSHIALPGLGLALVLKLNPVIGAAAALALGALLIWQIENHSKLATETTIGVIFAAAIAIGALVTPSEDIIEALFGGEGAVSLGTLLLYIVLSLVVIGFVLRYRNQLVLGLFNADLATTTGIKVSRLNLAYYLMFALTLILGLRFLGTLLVGALVIVPAATARQLTRTLAAFLGGSATLSMLSVGLGYWLADAYNLQAGPTIVSIAAGLFVISLFFKKD
ncbi:MAG TPA: metal ABC transporter permease [Candidatus Paceibacterota bacterium]|nr:metal ABC transporter permease [Candidatus Paceibacterota bacterium]